MLTTLLLTVAERARGDAFRFDPTGEEPTLFSLDLQAESSSAAPTADAGNADETPLEPYITYARDFNGTAIGAIGVCMNWFVADDLSVGVFIEAMAVNQTNDNALGGGGGVLMRWHFHRTERHSLFAELGVGFAGFSAPVPSEATTTSFTPRAAVGMSFPIDADSEFSARIGWLHLSNAQTGEQNPGIDALSVSLALSIEF
jgi:hypothetical protein